MVIDLIERQPRVRVFIADDNRSFRRAIRLRLEKAESIIVVGEAANDRDAVLAARAERADVVLMDLEMPGMNGIDATRALASTDDLKIGVVVRVIVLLTSGVTANDDIPAQLGVSVNTIRSHIQSAMREVGAGDRTQLALWGVRNGIDDFTLSSK